MQNMTFALFLHALPTSARLIVAGTATSLNARERNRYKAVPFFFAIFRVDMGLEAKALMVIPPVLPLQT